jgi:hypothetical protein
MTVKLIAFHGPKGSGKTTAAQALEPLGFKRLSFADPVKEILNAAFPSILHGLNTPELKDLEFSGYRYIDIHTAKNIIKKAKEFEPFDNLLDSKIEDALIGIFYKSYRELMQKVATDVFRKLVDDNYWCKIMDRRLQTMSLQDVVIDDVRFPNEQAVILRHGGLVVRVAKDGKDYSEHESEQPLECSSFIINDVDSVEEFKESTQAFLIMMGVIDEQRKLGKLLTGTTTQG